MTAIESWGRLSRSTAEVRRVDWRDDALPLRPGDPPALPFGLGRSYGDSCLNDGGVLLLTGGLSRFISFDRERGVLVAEAGVSLEEVLRLTVPQGWFLPVTPGTKFVTLGGAIANDVHGKNHHLSGTFGRFVRRFELLRSTGERVVCSPAENAELYRATIGGLGLTGLITWVELELRRVHNPFIVMETVRFSHVDEFFQLSAESERDYEYIVAWVDCLARGRHLGRGLLMRGNHAPPQFGETPRFAGHRFRVPFQAPPGLVNGLFIRAMNFAYYRKQLRRQSTRVVHYDPFFYPLDSIHRWNLAYGPRGFFQHQCVVPYGGGGRAIHRVLETIAESGTGSTLAVLKTFGRVPSPGLLSFPREGVTLALDFPNLGRRSLELFERIDAIVRDAGGAIYPAKDARMAPESFRSFFPQWTRLRDLADPGFGSAFWRRVTGEGVAQGAPAASLPRSTPPLVEAGGI